MRGKPRRAAIFAIAVAALLVAALARDLIRPPSEQWTARMLIASIHLYQRTLSPHMDALGVHCRFHPTCSHYAVAVIKKDGALKGTLRALWRVMRCGPWTPRGTYDPP